MCKKLISLILWIFTATTLIRFLCVPISAAGTGYVRPDKIVMAWDFIETKEDNRRLIKRHVYESLDVISPTWFSINDSSGEISSLADADYVRRAHDNGVKVWALFDNGFNDRHTFQVLSDADKRKKLIAQILKYAQEYGLDGINIDFEAMSRETGKYFEDFIIELYGKLRPLKICLSVDIPLPVDPVLNIYNIARIAGNSDYIAVMAYDQHHEYSDIIGPVASIGWVLQGVEETLKYVPSDKIILGVPFYTRIWCESRENGGLETTSQSEGMRAAYSRFRKAATTWYREKTTGQIYAEYSDHQKRYKGWLEDEHSLSLKLDVVNDYNLAGMSAWRLGLEWTETWNLVHAYFA